MALIHTLEDLESIATACEAAGCCAFDTEFIWERTYYATLGVVQVGLPNETCVLIDAPAVTDWSPIARVLANPAIVKILHDAQQDLRILKRACGALPKNIFDTQRASGFIGLTATISLAELLKTLLRVRLDKSETRSDWLKRPLSDVQLRYAEDDVRYMAQVRDLIIQRAEKMGRRKWLDEEMSLYDNPALYEEAEVDEGMPRVRGAGALTRDQRDVLRALAAWREDQARRRNLPRPFIISDEALLALTKRPPANKEALSPIKGLPPKTLDRHRNGIWEAIERGKAGDLPPLIIGTRRGNAPDDGFEARVDLALAFVKGCCLSQKIDPALVGNRADITAFVQEADAALPEDHAILRGWRRTFIGEPLLGLLAGQNAIGIDAQSGFPGMIRLSPSTTQAEGELAIENETAPLPSHG